MAIGQVEAGPALPNTRGRQIDRQPTERPRQAARQDGGVYPVPCFTDRGVREADDGEAREAVGDVDLDGDWVSDGSVQGGGGHCGEHVGERSPALGWERAELWGLFRSGRSVDDHSALFLAQTIFRLRSAEPDDRGIEGLPTR